MNKSLLSAFICSWAFFSSDLNAGVTMPSIFGDHMVLQQDQKLPIWGWADPGEEVSVTFAGQNKTAKADPQGKWRLDLDPIPANPVSAEMNVKSTGTNLLFKDVLVGEVWLCSGQSNMVASQRNLVTKEVGDQKQIRFFITPLEADIEPQKTTAGKWVVCEPQPGFENPYSAVGYYFALDLQKARNTPVGMIQSAWGGTSIAPWIDMAAFEKSDFKKWVDPIKAQIPKLPELRAKYEKEVLPIWEEKHKQWVAARDASKTKPEAGTAPAEEAEGEAAPSKPAAEPKRPPAPGKGSGTPTAIFNSMVLPHIPYGIKGVLWYQGESNAQTEERCREYAALLPLLITGWRDQWGQGAFPFYIVQLPFFTVDRPWTALRNAQYKALSVPNTALAVITDLNPTDNLHPPRKEGVGERLALLARKKVYGEELVASGPFYESMKIEGDKIRVQFTETGGGLVRGGPPPQYRRPNEDLAAEKSLLGFQVAAADGVWVPAMAEIEGNSVVVKSDQVPQPVHVSYAWANYPKANLYNKEGLPAAPFRSDDLPEFLQGK